MFYHDSVSAIIFTLLLLANEVTALSSSASSPNTISNSETAKTQYAISTIKNFRPVISSSLSSSSETGAPLIWRSASLDELSMEDAKRLLDGSAFCSLSEEGKNDGDDDDDDDSNNTSQQGLRRPISAIIDLRNIDEIQKGQKKRTDGSNYFYDSITAAVANNSKDDDDNNRPRLYHIPILKDVNEFWDEAITRMDPIDRTKATIQTAWKGGALDIAAARNMENGGHSMLYTIMMSTYTGSNNFKAALDICLQESKSNGTILFHCQKGKDRTGILAVLIEYCILAAQSQTQQEEEEIVKQDEIYNILIDSYAMSGQLLGGEDSNDLSPSIASKVDEKDKTSQSGMVDWSYFRGSPKIAMKDTLEWMQQRYGSIDGYLDSINFGERQRQQLRDRLQ